MALINENYLRLSENYFYTEMDNRINAFCVTHPKANVIQLGTGDVSQPLPPAVVSAMTDALNELSQKDTFRGYGPGQGYKFLREKIVKDYQTHGVSLSTEEVFVSDGAKTDAANIGHIFGRDNIIAITDPVYPVYENATIMSGRAGYHNENGKWSNIVYLNCLAENGFKPVIPSEKIDVIYLCYPNNPTGTVLTRQELKVWVDYALENHSLIIYDGAYEAYITEKDVPHSIYEIKGAKKVAVEIRSFSKTAGFTGLRCSYTIVPKDLIAFTSEGEKVQLNRLWMRRQTTCFNGNSYIVQRGAEAVFSKEGRKQVNETVQYYLTNAGIIRDELRNLGFEVYGGVNSPYVWAKTKNGEESWNFFQRMLCEINVVSTPGVGFGPNGEGYTRFSGFNSRENTMEAVERMKNWR